MNNKKISSALIYLAISALLVILQVSLIGLYSGVDSIFRNLPLYYSLLVIDFYMIVLFFINYYIIAPYMIRRALYKQYALLSLFLGGLGFLLPILFYSIWAWSLPGLATDAIPFSEFAFIGPIAVMSIGLSIRAISEWAKMSDNDADQNKQIADQEKEIKAKALLIKELEAKLKDLENKKKELEIVVPEKEKDNSFPQEHKDDEEVMIY